MTQIEPKIEESWKSLLAEEFNKDYFSKLKQFLVEERQTQKIFPPGKLIFNAFDSTPVYKVKVVILGQDPYHGPGQAHGLCFSVPEGIKQPPSLVKIFKEQKEDIGIEIPRHGNLQKWADQGVLLLNATLTVRSAQAGSHQKRGWETFTDAAIQKLSENQNGIVFLLWGRYAQNKEAIISRTNNHLILKAAHPSPLSAYNGFFGCKHFSKANEFLLANDKESINWQV